MPEIMEQEGEEQELLCPHCGYPEDDCQCCPNCDSYPCECCPECDSYPCECCPNCDSYPCECCPECDSYPCECRHGEEELEDYSTRKDIVFRAAPGTLLDTAPTGQLFTGIEIEMEAARSDISTGLSILAEHNRDNLFIAKHDGSLDYGLELVSDPVTLDYLAADRPRWESLLDSLRSAGYRAWDTSTAGIHIHLSRSAFTTDRTEFRTSYGWDVEKGAVIRGETVRRWPSSDPGHLWRFSQVMARNPGEFQRFAGRSGSDWARFDRLGETIKETVCKKGNYSSADRYQALNMENRETVECRIFRSTLNAARVMGDFQLLHALFDYTRDLSLSDILDSDGELLTWRPFAQYVLAHDRYADAAAIIAENPRLSDVH